ncbi:MAG: hypothetical protein DA405_11230 [Bacteroidetes bacterium]|nr:MAG: hypothetical protein DA405_11230 [Bacteroidota bacterium]
MVILTFSLIAISIVATLSFFQGAYSGNGWLGGLGLVLISLLIYRGPAKFKYDTEGEVMNLSTEDQIWGKILRSFERQYEFPKRKFKGYKLEGWFLRRKLTIYINSRSGTVKERTLIVSHLTAEQRKKLTNSLNKYSQIAKHGGRRKRTTE